MARIEGAAKEVVEKSEWVAIATAGPDGPHLAACWSHNVRALGIDGEEVLIPAWRYFKTEENLRRDNRVELLFASRQVQRPDGQGQGCCIVGKGEVQTTGLTAETVKARFPWARGVLVVTIEQVKTHL
ncbi:MAG: pyridoxamine 5'-phosphate oxidase family protein [Verrucomicrobiota bacterium]